MAKGRRALAEEVRVAAVRIQAEMYRLPPEERLDYLRGAALETLPEEVRDAVESLVLAGIDLSVQGQGRRWLFGASFVMAVLPIVVTIIWGERIGALAFGTVFLAGLLALVFGRESITGPQAQLVRTITAFAAGATMFVVPGFLDVSVALQDWKVRAGGGLAAFLIVYWRAPAK